MTTDTNPGSRQRNIQLVVKVSKFCNLRCTYCYEYPYLSDKAAMSREQLAAIYRNLHGYFAERDADDGMTTRLDFIWHGGEPLMQDPQLYWDTFADQAEILGERARQNQVQTNLVLLDDERLRLLTQGFSGVGVSLDVVGGLRVNVAGRDPQEKVVENLDRLHKLKAVGAITVLTARNINRVAEIFRFYEQRRMGFRVLPLFDSWGEQGQTAPYEITQQQELAALAQLVELWLASETIPAPPAPLDQYIAVAARYLTGAAGPAYRDRRAWLPLISINTDGHCYTYGEPYGDPEWSIGNIFNTPLADMLRGAVFEKCAASAERRVAHACLTCPFFDACGGAFMAETEQRHRDHDAVGAHTCMARPVIDYTARRLQDTMPDLLDQLAGDDTAPPTPQPA